MNALLCIHEHTVMYTRMRCYVYMNALLCIHEYTVMYTRMHCYVYMNALLCINECAVIYRYRHKGFTLNFFQNCHCSWAKLDEIFFIMYIQPLKYEIYILNMLI